MTTDRESTEHECDCHLHWHQVCDVCQGVDEPSFDPHPPRIAVDGHGYVWRVYPEHWSMCPVNPDNRPIPEPPTFYYPCAALVEAARHVAWEAEGGEVTDSSLALLLDELNLYPADPLLWIQRPPSEGMSTVASCTCSPGIVSAECPWHD